MPPSAGAAVRGFPEEPECRLRYREVRLMPRLPIGDLPLRSKEVLRGAQLYFETWGAPAREAVLVCQTLTSDARPHATRPTEPPGWWEGVLGPGHVLDPASSFVICANVIGGCHGSTGPDERGRAPDGRPFPALALEDMVSAQLPLLAALGVERLRLVVGGSLGGMQALAWASQSQVPVDHVVAIAAADRLPALQLALCHAQHVALELGLRHGDLEGALQAARTIALSTYLCDRHLERRFGREPAQLPGRRFALETYLDHHGRRFAQRFSPQTYLALSQAMTSFDWGLKVQAGTRVDLIAISSDWLFPPEAVQDLHLRLRRLGVPGDYLVHRSDLGHDAFLVEQEATAGLIGKVLSSACPPVPTGRSPRAAADRA